MNPESSSCFFDFEVQKLRFRNCPNDQDVMIRTVLRRIAKLETERLTPHGLTNARRKMLSKECQLLRHWLAQVRAASAAESPGNEKKLKAQGKKLRSLARKIDKQPGSRGQTA